ncbi:MAG: hypothetical protein Q8W44_05535 [Candidatus Palauibacterales bacterium]|nr:hypothetical protein [Candidatus Palauibacterales bacterium]
MHPVLQRADGYQDLLELRTHDAPYRFDSIFGDGDGGWWARLLSRGKLRLLRGIDEELREMLGEDEEVYFLSSGSDTSGLEAWVLGWWLYLLFRRAIVLTDRRILFLQIDVRGRPKELRSQLRYPAIAGVGKTLLGRAEFELQNGETEVLAFAPRRDADRIREITGEMRMMPAGSAARTGGVEHLCPHCHAVVEGRPDRCSTCGGSFGSARRAAGLSLLLPGLGDHYLGHRWYAAVEAAVSLLLWLLFAIIVTAAEASASTVLLAGGVVFAVVHGLDAAATWYVGRKALYPGEESPEEADAPGVRPATGAA